ncbi:preprotein translocase subunit SecG [Patescibacteria group bacterium]|nr:preprotein translocase subunit SecG [Patescibacteria group bacterium]
MKAVALVIHLIVSVALVGLILMQSTKGGLGSAFGGGEVYRTRRGAERIVFLATVVVSVLFLLSSMVNLLIHS